MGWKEWLERLRRRVIVDPLANDPRSPPGTRLLGHDANWVFKHAVGGGQADFDQPIADLLPHDRAKLYALLNQKGHIDELIYALELFLPEVQLAEGTTVLDIGCGPFTAGLALANVVGSAAAYRYYGFDRAASMLALGQELANGARDAGAIHERTTVAFHRELAHANFGPQRAAERTLFVLSYLLASDTIDLPTLVSNIAATAERVGWGPIYVLYTNSVTEFNRRHFPFFAALMEAADFQLVREEETTQPRRIHYALFTRSARHMVPIGMFST